MVYELYLNKAIRKKNTQQPLVVIHYLESINHKFITLAVQALHPAGSNYSLT